LPRSSASRSSIRLLNERFQGTRKLSGAASFPV
jgi:hypothetical protein